MTIVKRTSKGSALTYAEMDENIRDLDEDTTLDKVILNGNTTSRAMTVGSVNVTGSLTANSLNVDSLQYDGHKITSNNLVLGSTAGNTYLQANTAGALDLYHNNSIKLKTTANGIFVYGGVIESSATYRAGEVIETLALVADGTSVTVQSGSYSLTNVTGGIGQWSASYTDVPGSSIDYTPPAGTSVVQYEFHYQISYYDATPKLHQHFYIDSVEVDSARKNHAGQYFDGTVCFIWNMIIGDGDDASVGKFATWTTSKNLKLQARSYDSSNEMRMNESATWDGVTGANQYSKPVLTIRAIA